MHDFHTTYLGLKLDNPIVIGSGPLTATIEGLKKCEASGAGAVVVKSIFEEQILGQAQATVDEQEEYLTHSDAATFVREHAKEEAVEKYLSLISEAKKTLHIPVIASINASTSEGWAEYCKRMEDAGADAIEVNHYTVAANGAIEGSKIEKEFIQTVKNARKAIRGPMVVKMGMFYSSVANLLHQFEDLGVNGAVLFNRFFQNDIDIKNVKVCQGSPVSSPSDYLIPLRWTALMSAELKMDICTSGGVWTGETVIKDLLAGAKAVQICSVAMREGLGCVEKMKWYLGQWMDQHGFTKLDDFAGKLAQERMEHPDLWERSQYMKAVGVKA